ncbi:fibrinogen-like protein 1-like protein [Stegostoma tigrinum]|uniref:fibrinogen-like protein 1-like protein n=1 Tax=Stegostoma tigrinum TaxID=3053191 RepID=UPI00286FC7A5|nr:fibrinogen-like protein 1-like protein [Stegostoma tigrinum]
MFSHRTLSFLLLAILAVEKCSAFTPVYSRLLNTIENIDALSEEQKSKILNANPDSTEKVKMKQDCMALNRNGNKSSGIYVIHPKGYKPLVVYCFMDAPGKGWVMLQHVTKNSNISFATNWDTYKRTFGNMEDEHWLGNEYIHWITQQARYEVKFLIDSGVEKVAIDYASFNVENESNNYKLRLGAPIGVSQTEKHLAINKNDNMMFSTFDKDNDRDGTQNCAAVDGGGWWFNHCTSVIFNNRQIRWPGICDNCESATILIRRTFENCK